VRCARCGQEAPPGANFCPHCGQALVGRGEAATVSVPVLETEEGPEAILEPRLPIPAGKAALVMKRGTLAGAIYMLDKDVVRIGRHPDSDIHLDDITVSRRHAEIHYEDGSYVIKDAGSLNGTYVNRERVEERRLVSGDEIQVGKFKLLFLMQPENQV
jgi:hypothetical protein